MLNKKLWARVATLTASLAIITAALPAGSTFAQQTPSLDLEQARAGEDGASGSGAGSGNTSTGNAERDRDGNGGNASAGNAGEGGTTESADAGEEALPENAEVLEALGVLEEVTTYDLDVLNGLDIPITLLPPPAAEPVSTVPDDINTGGVGASGETAPTDTATSETVTGDPSTDETVTGDTSTGETPSTGETSSISAEPGTGAAPAGGSTGTAADDGVGSTENGERVRDRPRKSDGGATEAPGG